MPKVWCVFQSRCAVTRLEKLAAVAEVISALVVSISVVIAVMAYLNETDKQRRQFTMELAMQYFAGDLQNAKDQLFYEIQEVQSRAAPAVLGASDLRVFINKSRDSNTSGARELSSALLAISSFFNSAERCVKAGLCDADLMRGLIGEDATSIQCIFSGYLGQMARTSNVEGLSSGLQYFQEGQCA